MPIAEAAGRVAAGREWVWLVPLVVLVFALALTVRWHWAATLRGPLLAPRPDALEYAASAQALAQSGRFFLQVGPARVRPRYSPGWPMVLALAVRLGVRGEDLWRVTGLAGAALASLLAVLSARAVLLLHAGAPTRLRTAGAAAAGLLAGGGWALAPIAAAVGAVVGNDEPVAAASVGCLLLAALPLLRPQAERAAEAGGSVHIPAPIPHTRGSEQETGEKSDLGARRTSTRLGALGGALSGLLFGLLASLRPVAALLLLPALLILVLGSLRRPARDLSRGCRSRRSRPPWRFAVAFLGGAAVVPLSTALILWHSGLAPWRWTGYEFWIPYRFAKLGDAFELRNLIEGNPQTALGADGRVVPHLEVAARVLAGIPGLSEEYLGLYWPLLGWLSAAALIELARRRGGEVSRRVRWTLAAALGSSAAYVVLYSLYFFPTTRFYLFPLALPLTLLAVACGLAIASRAVAIRVAGWVGALALGAAMVQGCAGYCSSLHGAAAQEGMQRQLAAWFRVPAPERARYLAAYDRTRSEVASWLRLSDAERARQEVPFDPVYAQALGLLGRQALAGVHAWGTLPPTIHVQRLKGLGILPP